MPASFGHHHGINLTNYRLLSAKKNDTRNGFRAPADWQIETLDQIEQGANENKLSATLRNASQQLQDSSHRTVVSDLNVVDSALRSKIGQTETLKGMLEGTLTSVLSEISELVTLRGRLEERLNKVGVKLDLNQDRLNVRSARPAREKTMDEVERSLINQQSLLAGFVDKVKRAVAQVDREIGVLEAVRGKLEADLRDKADAIIVDETVLRIPTSPDVMGTLSSTFRKNHDCSNKTPHTWIRNTEENLRNAQHWITDSKRLRKAIRHAIQHSREVEHGMAAKLNDHMLSKAMATRALREDLEGQLERMREEAGRALSQRNALAAALESKRGPLAQAKERLAVRKARPCRETVADDVEAALAREIANLAGATASLTDKLKSVDKEIANLDVAATMLEDNIRDKGAALGTDERVIMMDGRINMPQPPPSSVASWATSDISTARSATLQRIRELESTLASARREREDMEASIRQLRESMVL